MQVTKGTWRMREQCVPGSLSSLYAQEPGNEAKPHLAVQSTPRAKRVCLFGFLDVRNAISLCLHFAVGAIEQ